MSDLLVCIRKNHIEVLKLKDGRTASGSAPFTSTRLLVGNFPVAESLLIDLVKQVGSNGLFAAKPLMILQPLEMTEGGLSVVEERAFFELGASAGARHVKIHIGDKLNADAAKALLRA